MAAEPALAVVIRLVDFSESSRVVTLFTREFGKVGALAKGAKRLKSAAAGALDLLSVSRIMLLRKQSSSLDLLTEAVLEKGFTPLRNSLAERNSLQILYAGYYVAELLSELTHEDDPHAALFDAVVETLRLLESGADVGLALRRFELIALRETGHLPAFDQCAGCGAPLGTEPVQSFSVRLGGVLCRSCSAKHGATVRIHAGTVKTMRILADAGQTSWRRLRLTTDTNREMRAVASAAVQYLTGRPLRTAKLLGDDS